MKNLLLVSAAVVAFSGSVLADTVTCSTCVAGGSSAFPTTFSASTIAWTNNTTPVLTPGTPFWNDPSDDPGTGLGQGATHMMNIGYVLTDSGGLTGTTSVLGSDTVTSDFVAAGGTDPAAFNFVRNATAYNVTLLFADGGENTGTNPVLGLGSQFGYYSGSTFTALYNVGQTFSPTGTQAFNPSVAVGTAYGFYDTVCYTFSGGVCTSFETYTTASGAAGSSPGGAAWNHFALFQLASGAYVIGFTGQNGVFGENLGDFQDTVVEISLASVPEPGTVAIMGLGLAALGVLGRRRFARK